MSFAGVTGIEDSYLAKQYKNKKDEQDGADATKPSVAIPITIAVAIAEVRCADELD